VGGGWALEIETFLGPVKRHRAVRRMPFGAKNFPSNVLLNMLINKNKIGVSFKILYEKIINLSKLRTDPLQCIRYWWISVQELPTVSLSGSLAGNKANSSVSDRISIRNCLVLAKLLTFYKNC
jgi:hypothetical protein